MPTSSSLIGDRDNTQSNGSVMLAGARGELPRACVLTRTSRCSSDLATFGGWVHCSLTHSRRLQLGRIGATRRGVSGPTTKVKARGSGKNFSRCHPKVLLER